MSACFVPIVSNYYQIYSCKSGMTVLDLTKSHGRNDIASVLMQVRCPDDFARNYFQFSPYHCTLTQRRFFVAAAKGNLQLIANILSSLSVEDEPSVLLYQDELTVSSRRNVLAEYWIKLKLFGRVTLCCMSSALET